MSVAIAIRRSEKNIARRATALLIGPVNAKLSHPEPRRRSFEAPGENPSSSSAVTIRKQLARICRSEGFSRAARMRRFLVFVVEETLLGRRDEISEYSIALAVFDRNESFEPGLNPIVRNEARRLRHKLDEYYNTAPSGEQSIVIAIPKGGYVPVFHPTTSLRWFGEPQTFRIEVTIRGGRDRAPVWVKAYQLREEDGIKIELELTSTPLREIEVAGPGA